MEEAPIALLAGATGAVGGELLRLLLARGAGEVVTVGRRAPGIHHPRLSHFPAELHEIPVRLSGHRFTEAFCCLGTTIRKAGSRTAFRSVDLEGAAAFADAARSSGASFFGLVSAAGASPGSGNFYLRTKGEAEAAVEALAFPSLAIMQPGLLRGARDEFRPAERLGQALAPLTDRLLIGGLGRYRSVAVRTVAAALVAAAAIRRPGAHRFGPAEMEALAHAVTRS
jgi:uncharacterized protein YbjT (DUF2867 family)